jgi:hypothetical protein
MTQFERSQRAHLEFTVLAKVLQRPALFCSVLAQGRAGRRIPHIHRPSAAPSVQNRLTVSIPWALCESRTLHHLGGCVQPIR